MFFVLHMIRSAAKEALRVCFLVLGKNKHDDRSFAMPQETIDVVSFMDKCNAPDCPFYANPGCEGACSQHVLAVCLKTVGCLRPRLPQDVLEVMATFLRDAHRSRLLSDDEIVSRLGLSARDVLVDGSWVEERLLWLRHHDLPLLHCDEVSEAAQILCMPVHQQLRVHDAQRLMMAVVERHPRSFTRIAIEKAIVRQTLHRGALSTSLFPVGLCYHGTSPLTTLSSVETLRRVACVGCHHRVIRDGGLEG